MNILYITKLTGKLWAGPNYSVPAEIKSQSNFDNVCWYNINQIEFPEWRNSGFPFYNLKDIASGRLKDLPFPFNKPDIIVFEEPYNFVFSRIAVDVLKSNIPYVIVPRSTYTMSAQCHKRVKKIIGNILFMSYFIKNARAIHFLTEEERIESKICNNSFSFIQPNGIYPNDYNPIKKEYNNLSAVYIGRLEVYQKGLDMLMLAISKISEKLRDAKFTLRLYGPDREGSKRILENMLKELRIGDIVQICEPIFGNEKKLILKQSDMFIMTSRFEGLPMGLIEAMSYAKPCLVTPGTNMSKFIAENNAGWCCNLDQDSIANTLLYVLNDNDIYKKSVNAKGLSTKFSWINIAKNTHHEYLSLLKNESK